MAKGLYAKGTKIEGRRQIFCLPVSYLLCRGVTIFYVSVQWAAPKKYSVICHHKYRHRMDFDKPKGLSL